MINNFYVPYFNDPRMNYTKERLIDLGYNYVDSAESSEFLVLPIPVKKEMLNIKTNSTFFYGCGNYNGYDYNSYESFKLNNAYLTAEGAIALYDTVTNEGLLNKNILICGYGRIAKALHTLLIAYGCNITICSRSEQSKVEAIKNNANHITLSELANPSKFDIIFNTIPHCIFTKKELDSLDKNSILIDLASFPGGVDTLYANSKNINLIDGRKLPSRFFPKSAGYIIADTIHQIIKEERL